MAQAIPIKITEKQSEILERLLRRQTSTQRLARRINIILLAGQGLSNRKIGKELQLTRVSVRKWRSRWYENYEKLVAVEENEETKEKELIKSVESVFDDAYRSGRPDDFTPEQVTQIIAIACEDPQESNRPISHWVAEDVADEAMKRNIVEKISPRSIRRFFKRCGYKAPSGTLLVKRKS
jgi:transposase